MKPNDSYRKAVLDASGARLYDRNVGGERDIEKREQTQYADRKLRQLSSNVRFRSSPLNIIKQVAKPYGASQEVSEAVSEDITMLNKNHKASNPQTETVQLRVLAEDEQPEVRSRVAENPRSPLALLSELTWDNVPEVRASVASNPNVSMALLNWLAHDESGDVRYALAEDPNLPMCLLQELGNDANVYVAARAIQTINNINRERSRAQNCQCNTSKNQAVSH